MEQELLKIQLHRFVAEHGTYYKIMLHWKGCGSIDLAGPFTNRRHAVAAYKRITATSTTNCGKWRLRGSWWPPVESIRDMILDSVASRGDD